MLEILVENAVVTPILIIAFSILAYIILKAIIKRLLHLKIKKIDARKQKSVVGLISIVLRVFIFLIALMMILDTYGIDTRSLITSLGVASLIIGLALQDLIRDFITGFTVILEDQYSEGDIVTINGFTGTVLNIGLKTTRLQSATGEVRIISNRTIAELSNHSLEIHKSLIDVTVQPHEDVGRVREVLDVLCNQLTEDLSLPEPAQCLGVESIGGVGIQFRLIVASAFADRKRHARIFRERIKEALDKENISIAHPQMVINNG